MINAFIMIIKTDKKDQNKCIEMIKFTKEKLHRFN